VDTILLSTRPSSFRGLKLVQTVQSGRLRKIGEYKKIMRTDTGVSEKDSKSILLRYYRVFNLDQPKESPTNLG